MSLSDEQIRKLASLAMLEVSDGEIKSLAADFANLMELVDQVRNVDTSAVDGHVHVHDLPQPLREDKSKAVKANLASHAHHEQDGYVVVPKVI